jgi:hypothetical protein
MLPSATPPDRTATVPTFWILLMVPPESTVRVTPLLTMKPLSV